MLRKTVLDHVMELIGEHYVFGDKAHMVVKVLKKNSPAYIAAKTNDHFAGEITHDMFEVTKDLHLSLSVRMKRDQDLPHVATTAFTDNGIAIITISWFPNVHSAKGDDAMQEINSAFRAAEGSRGLIIDIRNNPGGDGSSVAMATSYLLHPEPILLAIYKYRAMKPGENWTWERLPHESNGHSRPLAAKPVVVLVNQNTFSAAEEFAYSLQQMHRATIIGETTRGGAHPSKRHIIEGTFVLSLPIAETISPFTNTNWEGKGVKPDIAVLSRDAMKAAKEYLGKRLGK